LIFFLNGKAEFRVLIKHCFLIEKKTENIVGLCSR